MMPRNTEAIDMLLLKLGITSFDTLYFQECDMHGNQIDFCL
jgi:hypothetical protein